eukprot:1144521-Pelagomonas_calceolata.AAC.1
MRPVTRPGQRNAQLIKLGRERKVGEKETVKPGALPRPGPEGSSDPASFNCCFTHVVKLHTLSGLVSFFDADKGVFSNRSARGSGCRPPLVRKKRKDKLRRQRKLSLHQSRKRRHWLKRAVGLLHQPPLVNPCKPFKVDNKSRRKEKKNYVGRGNSPYIN